MNNKLTRIIAFCFLVVLFGCQEAPAAEVAEATPAAVEAATETAVPPTNTAEPTEAPTETAVPTETNTPTLEPTATNTATPTEPPTETSTSEPTATNTVAATATAVEAPATATTAPPAPVSAPPPAPAPSGPNLLANPGFENGFEFWEAPGGTASYSLHTADSQPNFVHSGQRSLKGGSRVWQRVSHDITPGMTYRAGGWYKVWSSTQEDRNVSVDPADLRGRICLNTFGDDALDLPTTICSGWVRPLDVWQFISVDAVATNDRVTVILQVVFFNNDNGAIHIESMWDDITLGTAPASATATPPPAPQPVRPNPIAFSSTALRDSMTSVRWTIEQAGGLLDRLYNGESGSCEEYQGYYDDGIRSAIYSGVPDDWAGIYNDYIFAVENFLATNESINALCDGGGGILSALNYGAARQGINDSLNRLIPAVEAANAKLGG
ncbi:MAG: hypothetical protein H6652_13730 [Ardenticatenaceae bacterium]|nr:hypothetical protein [Ardenticatenaceae bacterium]